MSSHIPLETHPAPLPARTVHLPDPRATPQRSGWKLVLVVMIVLGTLVYAATLISGAGSTTRSLGPVQTHTIARGDLLVTVTEQGTLESSNNTEIKCRVRGDNTIIWVVESGTEVQPGDELVRLDTLFIEEQISERTKFAHLARSAVERSRADVANADLAVAEYLEGRFVSDLATLEKNLAVSESTLRTAKNMRDHTQMMSKSGYVSELEVEEKEFAVMQADLDVALKKTQIDVLKRFTKAEELAKLRGNLAANRAQLEADRETQYADEERLKRAEEELEQCLIIAESHGVVIYPTAEEWKETPAIEAGATVHKDQVLLLMPDLTQMQVEVGIHESMIDRIHPGLAAKVTFSDKEIAGRIATVAAVAEPAGWWTGNVVKYDTTVEITPTEGLKPGMSVAVEVIMARHENVVLVPAAAVLETKGHYACWVESATGMERRTLKIGDSSDMFLVVEEGLREGDEVVLNPLAFVEEAQTEAAQALEDKHGDGVDLGE